MDELVRDVVVHHSGNGSGVHRIIQLGIEGTRPPLNQRYLAFETRIGERVTGQSVRVDGGDVGDSARFQAVLGGGIGDRSADTVVHNVHAVGDRVIERV